MKLHDLRPDKGSTKNRKRVGRGISAGQGKTAGRGTKGQGARSGKPKGPGFEGGQLSIIKRMPFKRGFTNIFKIVYQDVNVDQLDEVFDAGAEVTPAVLAEVGLIKDPNWPVVILGRGELKSGFSVKAHRVSKTAREKIEGAGGSIEMLPLETRGAHATIKKQGTSKTLTDQV